MNDTELMTKWRNIIMEAPVPKKTPVATPDTSNRDVVPRNNQQVGANKPAIDSTATKIPNPKIAAPNAATGAVSKVKPALSTIGKIAGKGGIGGKIAAGVGAGALAYNALTGDDEKNNSQHGASGTWDTPQKTQTAPSSMPGLTGLQAFANSEPAAQSTQSAQPTPAPVAAPIKKGPGPSAKGGQSTSNFSDREEMELNALAFDLGKNVNKDPSLAALLEPYYTMYGK